jgi:NAD(P)-dependent dehydrogenase (short-subunit alcohol dehydrogenase family)
MSYTLVTGATSDIGKQICRTLNDNGYSLLMTDLQIDSLIEQNCEYENNHLVLALDFSDVENARNTLQRFIQEKGITICNAVFAAGIFAVKPLRTIDYGFLKKNFDIALFSIFEITQLLASKKVNADSFKCMVVVSSVSSIIGTKGYTVYSAVKAGMLGMMRSMAVELAPRVRVNAVMPGGIKTRATQFMYNANDGEVDPRYVLGEGHPSDIANTIEFLLSDKARWITGQRIVVDGGLTCC